MVLVGVENVDISGHYRVPTPHYWQKNVTKIHRRNSLLPFADNFGH